MRQVGPLRALLVGCHTSWCYSAALLAAVFVTFDRWDGVGIRSSALLVSSRGVLPSGRAGLLQVRGRAFDSALMASAGVAILWLAHRSTRWARIHYSRIVNFRFNRSGDRPSLSSSTQQNASQGSTALGVSVGRGLMHYVLLTDERVRAQRGGQQSDRRRPS